MHKIRIGITMGDPSGCGPAITLKALKRLGNLADFTVIGDRWVFERVAGCGKGVAGVEFIDLANVAHKNFTEGKIKAEYGRVSVEYIDKALELIKNNRIDCLVTCPVSKEAINKTGIDFYGHTQYLAKKTNCKNFVMLLLNKYLKISLVTQHIPLADLHRQVSTDKIYKTILLTYRGLKELFLIREPRIVVCGLNPHASDNGLLGDEENKIIKPALKKLSGMIKCIDGPKPADVGLLRLKEKKYDCAVVMYHDQALIPLKITSPDTGVNITLGLPFVRTSPLHGTAFDIAGNYAAVKAASLIAAIRLARKCALNRKKG